MKESAQLRVDEEHLGNNAIVFRDVWKSYGSKRDGFLVLKGLNLTVPQGTIYGLLGPSGCGKTTLLRSIVGRVTVTRGTVQVLNQPPGIIKNKDSIPRIGYMPQDICLNHRLTVNETMVLYGSLAGLDKRKIRQRCEFLMNFLGISHPDKKFMGNLSGGQQRRASLAVAMLHEPNLLILDEPTVGVDPVLRKNIWEYLHNLVSVNHSTIVITTHYIEEAGLAHCVGLMLNGRLLAENSPSALMEQHICSTLEGVFLKLCLQIKNKNEDDDDCSENDFKHEEEKYTETATNKTQLENKAITSENNKGCCNNWFLECPRWNRIRAYFIKDIWFFLRHKGLLIFEIFLPPLIILTFALSVGQPLFALPLGIVNHDTHEMSKQFLSSINDRTIIQVPYRSYEEAEREALLGHVFGIMYINSNFSDAMECRFLDGVFADGTAVNNSLISISLDMTNKHAAFTINAELLFAFQNFTRNALKHYGQNSKAGSMPIKFEEKQVYGSLELSFDRFLLPGFMLCATFFMAMGMTAVALITERYSGSLERSVISGGLVIEWMIGHVLAQCTLMIAQIFFMFVMTFLIFGFNCEGSYVLVALLCACQGVCGMNLGLLLSSICNSETQTIFSGLGVWMFSIITEGFLWPLEGMPYVLRYFSFLLPQTYAIEALRSIMNRGWDLTHTQIIAGFGASIMWSGLFLTVAWAVSRTKL